MAFLKRSFMKGSGSKGSDNSSKPPSALEGDARKSVLEEYFKSREVYRGSHGLILVDAFRFVEHSWPSGAGRGSFSAASPHRGEKLKEEKPPVKQESASWQAPAHKFFFLSHFHSDHYTGIQPSWHSDTIYCSRSTAAMTQSQLGVSSACLFPMDMNETYVFSLHTGACLACVPETPLNPRVQALLKGSTSTAVSGEDDSSDDLFAVRLIPANHCPGAAILLFASALFGVVVHTGDFRFNGSQQQWRQRISDPAHRTYISLSQLAKQARHSSSAVMADVPPVPPYEQFIEDDAALCEVAAQQALDVLFLDNTFCGPPYRFPSQWDVTQTVIEVLRSLFSRTAGGSGEDTPVPPSPPQCVRCAVLIGCYTIGKERVALAIRDAFPRIAPSEPSGEEGQKGAAANWRVHVSPTRYAMLSAMGFFPECFQRLEPRPATNTKAAGDDSDSTPSFAHVEDAEVELPVLLHSDEARKAWRAAQNQTSGQPSGEEVPLSREVRCSLGAEFSADPQVALANGTASAEQCPSTRHFLSVFLVSMGDVGYQAVANLVQKGASATVRIEGDLQLDLAPYDRVLLVEPTGWCKKCTTRDLSDKFTLLKVPYSEHCGFHEMLRFVQFMNPARVVPTVSEDSFKKHEALFVERTPRLRSRVSNVQPITRFFSVQSPRSRAQDATTGTEELQPSSAAPSLTAQTESFSASSPIAVLSDLAASVPATHSCQVLGATQQQDDTPPSPSSSSLSLLAATPQSAGSRDERKRVRGDAENRAAVTEAATAAAAAASTPSIAGTLVQLFRRVKAEVTTGASVAAAAVKTSVMEEQRSRRSHAAVGGGNDDDDDDDEDCQVVGVGHAVVEISDDDSM